MSGRVWKVVWLCRGRTDRGSRSGGNEGSGAVEVISWDTDSIQLREHVARLARHLDAIAVDAPHPCRQAVAHGERAIPFALGHRCKERGSSPDQTRQFNTLLPPLASIPEPSKSQPRLFGKSQASIAQL